MAEEQAVLACECGTDLPPQLLSCPACHRLVHAGELRRLVSDADGHERRGDVRAALVDLRVALDLLPPATRQHAVLRARVARLSDLVDSGQAPDVAEEPPLGQAQPLSQAQPLPAEGSRARASGRGRALKIGTAATGLGLLAWKFKFVLVLLASKAKLLALGLSKSTTLFTMLLSLGLYWTIWGWHFAAGLVLSIYVHEMGHVSALRNFGIRATAPMFLPGLGAIVRMQQYPQTAREDARVGLAGPIWGLGAAVVVLLAYAATDYPLLAAVGRVGAWINLFNLVPFWQLDGGRGFRALSRPQRWIATGVIASMGVVSQDGLLILLGIGAVMQALSKGAPVVGDRRTLLEYSGLVVALSLLAMVPVPA